MSFIFVTTACAEPVSDPVPIDVPDLPIAGLSPEDLARFEEGDALFGLPFRAADGLGPLYIRTACASCHAEGGRGPGLVQKMVVLDAEGAPAADQSALRFGPTVRLGLTAGATTAITPPDGVPIATSIRVGPPVFGRGYLEAIAEAEVERVFAEQAVRSDGVHGVLARVTFASIPNPDTSFFDVAQGQELLGRFGTKARIATLDDFTADALQGDMGLTTPMRPTELANPDGLGDDARAGIDLAIEHVDKITYYLRRVAIPARAAGDPRGEALFGELGCSTCHVPSLRTRADYPISQLAGVEAPVFTDLLLHDLGAELADGIVEHDATGRHWRTAPLIGLRFLRTYLHDGRAASVLEAVLAHGGEAAPAITQLRARSESEQRALIDYVETL